MNKMKLKLLSTQGKSTLREDGLVRKDKERVAFIDEMAAMREESK